MQTDIHTKDAEAREALESARHIEILDTPATLDVSAILDAALVPEHSIPFMEAMSDGQAFVEDGIVCLAQDDWLMLIGYPLEGNYSPERFESALESALIRTQARSCFAIAPDLPSRLQKYCVDRDIFYTLDAASPIPARLRRPVERAQAVLRIEEGRVFTSAHRQLWAEFLGRTPLKPNVRALYARTEAVLDAPHADLRLLNAWDSNGHLAACLLMDYTPKAFSAYIIGAHSRKHSTPYAADALFAKMLESARLEGKQYIHLGLGVHDGIRRFKLKWGALPALPYCMASWEERPRQGARQGSLKDSLGGRDSMRGSNGPNLLGAPVDTFMKVLLAAPSDLSKRQIMALLPEQRPFAMMWELTKNGKRSYIAGTAHFFCYSFEHAFRRIFEDVDTVIFEGPLDNDFLQDVQRIGHSPDPSLPNIERLLTQQEIRILERVVQGSQGRLARALNMAYTKPANVREILRTTRHWCTLFTLWTAFLERNGWTESVDLEAYRVALDMGKSVIGMESLEEQIASLESMPMHRVIRFCKDCTTWDATIKRNVRAYLHGSLESMMGTSSEFPTRTERIIGHRDQRFRERMLPYIEQGRTIVFVGAAHLLNLRYMLAEDGFRVRKVLPTWKHRLRTWYAVRKGQQTEPLCLEPFTSSRFGDI